jgi:glycosyltransferase involved in cell wall biosynthesis
MNPEYVVLAGVLWKIWGKKIALWYTHKKVDVKLRLAEKFSHIIFTASEKSFRLRSKKVNIMGHGIDTERFVPALKPAKEKIILSLDRISPTKNQLEIIKMFADIREQVAGSRLSIVGAPLRREDNDYLAKLKGYVEANNLTDQVKFYGAVANKNTPGLYRQAKVFVNFSATGSLDKAVLEAMACNVPVVTTNEAFKDILPAENYGLDFADARQKVIKQLKQDKTCNYREIVARDHSLKNLISNIIRKLI